MSHETKDERITRLQSALMQANAEIARLESLCAADGQRADAGAVLAGNEANARATIETADACFVDGARAAEAWFADPASAWACPHPGGSVEAHWWTRGFGHQARLLNGERWRKQRDEARARSEFPPPGAGAKRLAAAVPLAEAGAHAPPLFRVTCGADGNTTAIELVRTFADGFAEGIEAAARACDEVARGAVNCAHAVRALVAPCGHADCDEVSAVDCNGPGGDVLAILDACDYYPEDGAATKRLIRDRIARALRAPATIPSPGLAELLSLVGATLAPFLPADAMPAAMGLIVETARRVLPGADWPAVEAALRDDGGADRIADLVAGKAPATVAKDHDCGACRDTLLEYCAGTGDGVCEQCGRDCKPYPWQAPAPVSAPAAPTFASKYHCGSCGETSEYAAMAHEPDGYPVDRCPRCGDLGNICALLVENADLDDLADDILRAAKLDDGRAVVMALLRGLVVDTGDAPAAPAPTCFTRTFCPACGPGVRIDEDGCCATCGATATGEAVEALPAAVFGGGDEVREAAREYIDAKDAHFKACGEAGTKWRDLLDRLRAAGTTNAEIERNADPADLAEFKASGRAIFAAADPTTARYKAADQALRAALARGIAAQGVLSALAGGKGDGK